VNPLLKKITGILLVLAGLLILLTPFTPGSWIIFVGLELLGIRLAFWKKMKLWFQRRSQKGSVFIDKTPTV